MADFKKLVADYVRLDDDLKEQAARAKVERAAMKERKEAIISFMGSHEITTCNIRGGSEKLVLGERTKKPKNPNKDEVISRLTEFCGGDRERAEQIYRCVRGADDEEEAEKVLVLSRRKTPSKKRARE